MGDNPLGVKFGDEIWAWDSTSVRESKLVKFIYYNPSYSPSWTCYIEPMQKVLCFGNASLTDPREKKENEDKIIV